MSPGMCAISAISVFPFGIRLIHGQKRVQIHFLGIPLVSYAAAIRVIAQETDQRQTIPLVNSVVSLGDMQPVSMQENWSLTYSGSGPVFSGQNV